MKKALIACALSVLILAKAQAYEFHPVVFEDRPYEECFIAAEKGILEKRKGLDSFDAIYNGKFYSFAKWGNSMEYACGVMKLARD